MLAVKCQSSESQVASTSTGCGAAGFDEEEDKGSAWACVGAEVAAGGDCALGAGEADLRLRCSCAAVEEEVAVGGEEASAPE